MGYEARKSSKELASLCCEVFAANRIRSFLFDGLRATPEISFAVRHIKATAGVQITASHNPRTDNGFKFYWDDGGQVVPPRDAQFMRMVSAVKEIHRIPIAEAEHLGLVSVVGQEIDVPYLNAVRSLATSTSRSANIVFSPIHGAGSTNVLPVLLDEGFNVCTVEEQIEPDETFPTAPGDLINPEFREVMERPILASWDKVVAYSGDTEWTDALIEVARGADLFFCECCFFDKKLPNHLNYQTLVQNREQLECRRIVLTHMSDDMLSRTEGVEMERAEDGASFVL